MKYKYDETSAIRILRNKRDLKIFGDSIFVLKNKIVDHKTGESITNPNKSFDLGNKSWGKIDFLCNHCGYNLYMTDKL